MHGDGEVVRLAGAPDRVVLRMVQEAMVRGVGADEAGSHAQLLRGELDLLHRTLDRLHRHHGHAEQALRVHAAIVGQPAVVGMAGCRCQARVTNAAHVEPKARVEE